MYPAPFALERFFARYEFSARYLLSASDCQGPTMAELVDAADDGLRTRWEHLELGYTESQGLPELRADIATQYGRVDAEQVIVAAPEEAVFLTMHALLAPGDHVICTFPGYQSLYELARSIGCEVDFWEPAESPERAEGADGTGWRFDPAGLEGLIRPNTRLVVWNFPHNPTGALPPAEDFTRMVAAVANAGAWLFSDEMYRLLEPAPELRLPAAADLYERAVSLGGMSKAFGLAGLRIGWVAAHDQTVLERIKSLKDYTTICSSAPSELLALMALRERDGILAANVARIGRQYPCGGRVLRTPRRGLQLGVPAGRHGLLPATRVRESRRGRRRGLLRAGARADRSALVAVDRVRLRRFALPTGPGPKGLQRGTRGAGRVPRW